MQAVAATPSPIPRRVPGLRRGTPSPAHTPGSPEQELQRRMLTLDVDIKDLEEQVSVYEQAILLRKQAAQDRQTEELTTQWREAGLKAALYLYNDTKCMIERMGGYAEYTRRRAERAAERQQQRYMEDVVAPMLRFKELEDYKALLKLEQADFDLRVRAAEKRAPAVGPEGSDHDKDTFTMEDMLVQMRVNPVLFARR